MKLGGTPLERHTVQCTQCIVRLFAERKGSPITSTLTKTKFVASNWELHVASIGIDSIKLSKCNRRVFADFLEEHLKISKKH